MFSSDAEVIATGSTYVLLVGMTQLFMAAEVVMLGAFAGAQWTAWPAVIVIGLTAIRVPLAMWLVARGWGVEAVWFAIASTTVVKGMILAALFGMTVWDEGAGYCRKKLRGLRNSEIRNPK